MKNEGLPEYNRLRGMIMMHEDVRERPYTCTSGKLTIGIGRNLTDNGISEDEIELMFSNDLFRVCDEIHRHCPWVFTQGNVPRMHAFIDMIFNLGMPRFLRFNNMIAAASEGDWEKAADEAHDSMWRVQTKGRAKAIIEMIRTGEYYYGV